MNNKINVEKDEMSLYEAIRTKNKKAEKEIEDRMDKGEVVRIL